MPKTSVFVARSREAANGGLSSNGTENWDRHSGVLRLNERFDRTESA
jgi:hypothetical protein